MKKCLLWMCVMFFSTALVVCNGKTNVNEANTSPSCTNAVSYNGTVLTYDGKNYNIAERISEVNSITSCTIVKNAIVVECHVSPKNGVFCIFNTETKQFEKDIYGNHLIWYDDDLSTAVYTFWSEIYNYEGDLIATIDMTESSIVYDLEFIDGNSKIQATIVTEDGEEKIQQFDL